MIKRVTYLLIILCGFNIPVILAQSLPVGSAGIEDYYRRQQLAGKIDSTISFTVRPLSAYALDSAGNIFRPDSGAKSSSIKKYFSLLPISWQNQFNSDHPYGWNDGAMMPAKGYQTMLSAGFYLEDKWISLQVKPEFVMAVNNPFDEFTHDHYGIIWTWYYNYYNNIDLPVRFGNKTNLKVYPGQSSLRFNYKTLSAGVSTENLWWGPGLRNSLLMSNTAPGFLHFTLNTRRPIQTLVGSFEGQFIAGKLASSGYVPPDTSYSYLGTKLFQPKRNDERYISGIVATWQPKWTPGLFLGFARTSQMYIKDLKSVGDYLPFFKSFNKYSVSQPLNTADRYTSLFVRWIWKEEQAEIYMEYGHNDQSKSFTDFMKDPNYGMAYIFGFRKLVPLSKSQGKNILVGLEITQLAQSSPDIVRNAGGWYIDNNIRHGYTNYGENLGAGIGTGGNLQSLDISWVKGLKLVGLQIERYVHNNDFYYYAYETSADFRRHWVDISLAARSEWDYKKMIISAKLQSIKSLNYQWYIFPGSAPVYIDEKGLDKVNVQLQFGLTYRF
jgi:hypothetical protein